MKKKIKLVGGPLNNTLVEDLGTIIQKICIYFDHDWNGDGVKGTECGYAIYEPDELRTKSFWLENLWDGDTLID
jgi:hypothetical protein